MILHIKTGVPKTTVPLCHKKKREIYLLYNNNNHFPNSICLSKRNSGNTRRMREICSKLTIKTPKQCHWSRSVVWLLTLNIIFILLWCFHCWFWTYESRLGSVPESKLIVCWTYGALFGRKSSKTMKIDSISWELILSSTLE